MPKTGRISIKGKKRVDKKYQRQSYNIEQKQAILKYWQECNSVESTSFCRKFYIFFLQYNLS